MFNCCSLKKNNWQKVLDFIPFFYTYVFIFNLLILFICSLKLTYFCVALFMPCTITTIYLCQLDIFVCMFICYSHCYRDCHCAPIIFLTNTTQLYFTCNEAGLRLKVCDILLASIHTLTSMNVCEYVRKMQHPTVHWWLCAHFCRLQWLLKLHVYHFVSTNDVIHCLCLFIICVLSFLCFFYVFIYFYFYLF